MDTINVNSLANEYVENKCLDSQTCVQAMDLSAKKIQELETQISQKEALLNSVHEQIVDLTKKKNETEAQWGREIEENARNERILIEESEVVLQKIREVERDLALLNEDKQRFIIDKNSEDIQKQNKRTELFELDKKKDETRQLRQAMEDQSKKLGDLITEFGKDLNAVNRFIKKATDAEKDSKLQPPSTNEKLVALKNVNKLLPSMNESLLFFPQKIQDQNEFEELSRRAFVLPKQPTLVPSFYSPKPAVDTPPPKVNKPADSTPLKSNKDSAPLNISIFNTPVSTSTSTSTYNLEMPPPPPLFSSSSSSQTPVFIRTPLTQVPTPTSAISTPRSRQTTQILKEIKHYNLEVFSTTYKEANSRLANLHFAQNFYKIADKDFSKILTALKKKRDEVFRQYGKIKSEMENTQKALTDISKNIVAKEKEKNDLDKKRDEIVSQLKRSPLYAPIELEQQKNALGAAIKQRERIEKELRNLLSSSTTDAKTSDTTSIGRIHFWVAVFVMARSKAFGYVEKVVSESARSLQIIVEYQMKSAESCEMNEVHFKLLEHSSLIDEAVQNKNYIKGLHTNIITTSKFLRLYYENQVV